MIGIIGAGNMGMAIATRLKKGVILSDIDKRKLRHAEKRIRRILTVRDNAELARRCDTIIFAVKPQNIKEVLLEVRPFVNRRLCISIAAGVSTRFIERHLGGKVKVVRVMPNMPALAGKGISVVSRGRFATLRDLKKVIYIFSQLGRVVKAKESDLDSVTAVSGSGPAYFFLLTYLLEKAAWSAGLGRNLAASLARHTFIGSGWAADSLDLSMQDLIKKVASKGGTTESALKVFKKMGLGHIVKEAVKAACERSRCLRD